MNKNLLVLFSLIILGVSTIFAQQTISLSEGTIIRVRLLETLDSRISKNGDMVNLEASEDVVVDRYTIVKKGAKVTGMINEVSGSGIAGKKGSLNFSIDYVQSTTGKNIKLRYSSTSAGQSRTTGTVAAALIINPLFVLVKGKSATIEKDKEFNVYVDKDYEFNTKDFAKTQN